jgi:cyclase
MDLINKVKNKIDVPMTVLGDAGALEDISQAIDACGIIGCAASSLFVFKGKYKVVLINYPKVEDKQKLF